jgi:hypothetical protein
VTMYTCVRSHRVTHLPDVQGMARAKYQRGDTLLLHAGVHNSADIEHAE